MIGMKIMTTILMLVSVSAYSATEPATVTIVYSDTVDIYTSEGEFVEEIPKKLVLKAKVLRGGKTNDMGLLKIALKDNNNSTAWVKSSHVATSYKGEQCIPVKKDSQMQLATAAQDSQMPVSSGMGANCDD